jgi:predicted nucleic acid-binding protein
VEVSRYCLDTVAYSHFKRGDETIAEILDRAEWIGVPVIVIGELCAGFARGTRFRENLAELDEFLAVPVVETLPVDRHVAEIFGEMIADLRRKGRPIPSNDIWIAATCARAGATLLTWDAHFRQIPRVGSLVFDSPV